MTPITLTLPPPISSNRYWRTFVHKGANRAITHVSTEAQAYRKQVAQVVANRCLAPIQGRVRVAFELYPARPKDFALRQKKHGDLWDDTVRSIDLDNAIKVMLDCLKGVIFEDDKNVFEIHGKRMEPDATGARMVVHIEPLMMPEPQLTLIA